MLVYKWIRFETSVLRVELTRHPYDRLTFSIAIGSRAVGGDCAVTGALFNFVWGATISLQWRHNERDGVSNHRRIDCLLNCFFRQNKEKSELRDTGLCEVIPPVSIWWRHHDMPLSDPLVLEIHDVAVSSHGNPRVVTGGIGGCYDDLRCIQWRSWQYDSSRFQWIITMTS